MNRRVIQLLLILGMVAAMPGAPAQLPVRAADRGTSAARATAPPLPSAPNSRGGGTLPRGCGGVTCISGFVYADGQAVAGAEVEIQNHDGITVTTVTEPYSGDQTPAYYTLNLSATLLSVQAGELITVTARYGGVAHSLLYSVQPGGQQVDVVLAQTLSEGYVYERRIWGQAEPRQFNDPRGLAVDGAGNIYVVDRGNARVQVFGPDKEFIRQWGTLGNLQGQFLHPIGMAVDKGGTVYVADTENHRIQVFSSTGQFIARWGGPGRADGEFVQPEGVALDSHGNVYVADKGSDRIQKFSSGGTWLETIYLALLEPIDVSVDPAGNIYVVGPGHIYKFDSGGVQRALWEGLFNADDPNNPDQPGGISADGAAVYVTAGSHIYVFDTALRPNGIWSESPAGFKRGGDIATDSHGHLYATDTLNHRILKLDASGNTIDAWGDYGRANGELSKPKGVAVGSDGRVYVADTQNDRIQVFSSGGAWLGTWYDTPAGEFSKPSEITMDRAGNIYIADTGNNRIQKRNADGHWTVLNGADVGVEPHGIAVDEAASLYYVTDTKNNRIWKLDAAEHWTLLGEPGGAIGHFSHPKGIALDSGGDLYVADSDNHRMLKRDAAGHWAVWGSAGQFRNPDGVSVDSSDRVYVADPGKGRIQKFTADGNLRAELGEGAGAGAGQFDANDPWLGISVGADGKLYVADTANNRIQIFHRASYTQPIATINFLPTPYITATGRLIAYGMGQGSSETRAIVAYRWTLDGDVLGTAPALDISATDLRPGTHRLGFAVKDNQGEWSDVVGADITVALPPVAEWTMLLYLAGDSDDRGRLLNDFNQLLDELRGSFRNPYLRIAVELDGPADGDTRRLLIVPGSLTDPPQVTETPYHEGAMDKPAELASFVRWGKDKFPANHYYLAIADHGQGIQGLAWDTTSNQSGSAFLTIKELGQALNEPGVGPIDVLHLDACTMDLLEVAYEVNSQQNQPVRIMIASQYLGWDYFAYDAYQAAFDTATSPPELARKITARYAELAHADGHPYTIAALDLQQMGQAKTALDELAQVLLAPIDNGELPQKRLDEIRQASQHFDSDGNYLNDEQDMYVDLVDWTRLISDGVSIPVVQEKAKALLTELTGPQPLIIASQAESNRLPPQYAGGHNVDLAGSNGVSIFYPQRQETEAFEGYVNNRLLSFTSVSHWPDFLKASIGMCSGCKKQPLPGPLPPLSRQQQVFLPIVLR